MWLVVKRIEDTVPDLKKTTKFLSVLSGNWWQTDRSSCLSLFATKLVSIPSLAFLDVSYILQANRLRGVMNATNYNDNDDYDIYMFNVT